MSRLSNLKSKLLAEQIQEQIYLTLKERDRRKGKYPVTFMRMKEDHMLNGQLKPAYNVQLAVENYFIVHSYVSNERTDYNTLIPVLEKHKAVFGAFPEETISGAFITVHPEKFTESSCCMRSVGI